MSRFVRVFWRPFCFLVIGCLTAVGISDRANAQDDAASQPDAAAKAADAATDAASSGAWERLIYLPYKNLKDVFEKHGSTVFMPYLEYLKLTEKAGGTKTDAKPPVPAVITESHYTARIDKDIARIEAVFTVQVLGKAWAEVPVRFGGAAVGKVTSGADEVILRGTGQGNYSLLFPKKGQHKVTLELEARIRTSPSGRSFAFDCPTVGVTTLQLVIPQADQTVNITPQLVSLPVEAGQNETRIKVNLGSTAKIAALWHPRASAKPQMDLLTSVTNYQHVSVADGLIHTNAYLNYEVLRGELNQLRIAAPLGHRILGVTSSNAKVKGWKFNDEANRQLIVVDFLSNLKDKVSVEVHTEREATDEAFDAAGINAEGRVHGIHAIGAVRESGQVIVTHGKDLSLNVEQQRGLVRIDQAEVYKPLRRPGASSYKYYSSSFELKMLARPIQPRITVDHFTQLEFTDDELRLTAKLNYKIERAGVFEIKLTVPEDLTIENAVGAGVKEHNVDGNVLTISLVAKRQGNLQLTVTGHRSLDADATESEHQLPLLEPLKVDRETGHIHVFAPDAIEVDTLEANLVGAQPDPSQQALRLPNARLASAWIYSRRPVDISVKTTRKPTRLTSTVGTTVEVKQEQTKVTTILTFNVEFAGLDTFRFSVPEATSKDVRIRSLSTGTAPAIKEQVAADEAADGWIIWTILMQRDVVGQQRFEISYELTPGEQSETAADNGYKIDVQPPRSLGLDAGNGRQAVELSYVAGEIVVTKDRALSVSAQHDDDDVLEPIDVRELQSLPRQGTLAFRYFKQPVALTVSSTKHDIQEVVKTVVSRALVEIVIGRDQTATYRCRYQLKSSERQRLQVDLPDPSELLGLLVNGKSVNPQIPKQGEVSNPGKNWKSMFVNVSRKASSDTPFSFVIQFQKTLDPALDGTAGKTELPIPRVGGKENTGVVVQQLRTAVWVPEKFALVSTPDQFVLEHRAARFGLVSAQIAGGQRRVNLDRWIGVSAGGAMQFPTEGHVYQYSSLGGANSLALTWWNMTTVTWVLSGAIVLITLVLAKTSWENRMGLVLLTAFAATMYGLQNLDGLLQGFAAIQYGLMFMIAYWLIRALAGVKLATANAAKTELTADTAMAAVIPPPGIFDDLQSEKKDKP